MTHIAFLRVQKDDRALSARVSSGGTCVQQSGVWNWSVSPVPVVWQPFGAAVSAWQMSLHLTDGSESLTEDQSSWLKPNKLLFCVWEQVLPVLKLFPVVWIHLFLKNACSDQADRILILSSAFCSRSQILMLRKGFFFWSGCN